MAKAQRVRQSASLSAGHPVNAPSPHHTLIEFFSGGGLARIGFGPNWNVLLANDICPDKAKTYIRNFGDGELIVGDVGDLRAVDLPQATVWWASFPCQDHSTAGLKTGFDGVRGSTVFLVVKRLKAAKRLGRAPAIVALENVTGLATGGGEDFRLLVNQLTSCGYRVGAVVGDAADWVPQSRQRVFIVAVRVDVDPIGLSLDGPSSHWHPPFLTRAVAELRGSAAEKWIWWNVPVPRPHRKTLADIVEDVKPTAWFKASFADCVVSMLDTTGAARLRKLRDTGTPRFAAVYQKTQVTKFADGTETRKQVTTLRADTAYAMLASTTGSARQRLAEVTGDRIRVREFTTREFGRLMGVPETYVLPNRLCPALKVLGDAVAVPVVRHLVASLIEPLLASAERGSSDRKQPPPAAGSRRPVKDRTTGLLLGLLPGEYQRVKEAAANDEVPLSRWAIDAISAYMITKGLPPLEVYKRSRRKTASK